MSTPTLRAPTPLAERAPGPDVARGAMLAFIALANSHYFLRGETVLGGFPQDGSRLDAALTWVLSTFVDGRAYPMFGLLFGYGVARVAQRHQALGPRGVRRLLRRRAFLLLGLGFAHAVLLYVGDILTAYGVLLLLGVWALRWRDRTLLVVAALFLALLTLPGDGSLAVSAEPPHVSMLPPDVASLFTQRPPVSLFVALVGPIGFAPTFLLGLWAGRRRILERPDEHRTLLRVTAVAGIATAVAGAQPAALVVSRVLPRPDEATLQVIGPLHDAAGVPGGAGYAALLVLLAARPWTGRARRFLDALVATGRRSMTCYLAQSVVWTLVFTPFLLDLSGTLTVATTVLLALATWLLTVALAVGLERRGHRGPFETLVRRVTYGAPRR